MPGSPAWHAGIEPGDEIVQIGNRSNPTFIQLRGGVTLGDLKNGIKCHVRRAADGKVVDITLKPQQSAGRLATIGIGMPFSLTLFGDPPVVDNSAAEKAKLIKPAADQVPGGDAKFMNGDQVIRVGDVPVSSYREFSIQLAQQPEKALQITVRRPQKEGAKEADENRDKSAAAADRSQAPQLTFEVPAQPLRRFSFTLKMGPITAVREGSPAAAAGLAAGDLIEQIDGKRLGEGPNPLESWDAETLPDYLRRAAAAGREVEIALQRPTTDGPAEQIKVRVTPRLASLMNMTFPARSPGTPMAANEIGIAYRIENEVARVAPNTPAAVARPETRSSRRKSFSQMPTTAKRHGRC